MSTCSTSESKDTREKSEAKVKESDQVKELCQLWKSAVEAFNKAHLADSKLFLELANDSKDESKARLLFVLTQCREELRRANSVMEARMMMLESFNDMCLVMDKVLPNIVLDGVSE